MLDEQAGSRDTDRLERSMFEVIEFFGDGDPYFGGEADDRILGKSGSFLVGFYSLDQVAKFATEEEARHALEVAPNRRVGGKPAIVPALTPQQFAIRVALSEQVIQEILMEEKAERGETS